MPRPQIHIQKVEVGSILAYARVPITLQDKSHFIVEMRVMKGSDGIWVALPQRKEKDGWAPVVQLPPDILTRVKKAVLDAYREQTRG